MSELLPLFPLPDVVLFPDTEIALHIFEPRYREMIRYALDEKLCIGMVLLKPGFQETYEGAPEIHAIGCMGDITACKPLPDGRYNIMLKGSSRFLILEEIHARAFRQAKIQLLPDIKSDPLLEVLEPQLKRDLLYDFLALGAALAGEAAPVTSPGIPDQAMSDLVNELAFSFPGPAQQRQTLLEITNPYDRALALRESLQNMATATRKEKGLPLLPTDSEKVN